MPVIAFRPSHRRLHQALAAAGCTTPAHYWRLLDYLLFIARHAVKEELRNFRAHPELLAELCADETGATYRAPSQGARDMAADLVPLVAAILHRARKGRR